MPVSAEAARSKLRELRLAVHAAVDERFDELERKVDAAEATKAMALERELVAVDAALERWRSDSAAFKDFVDALSDADLEAQHATLSSRIDDMGTRLQGLPTAVMEPPHVGVEDCLSAVLAALGDCGRIVAPLPVTAADLRLEKPSENSFAPPGSTLRLRLSLSSRYMAQSTEELSLSLGMLVNCTAIEAAFEAPGIEPRALGATFALSTTSRSLLVTLPLVAPSPACGGVVISSIFVAGLPVEGLPLRICVRQGIRAPLRLQGMSYSPCIFPDGLILLPPACPPLPKETAEVQAYDGEGARRSSLPLAALGISPAITLASLVSAPTPCLVVAESHARLCRLAALNPSTHELRWSVECDDVIACTGIAVFPTQGVIVLSSSNTSKLVIRRLSDGVRTGSLTVSLSCFLAGDPSTGTVFGILGAPEHATVQAWSCSADGSCLTPAGRAVIFGARVVDVARPLVVVPPAPGKLISHLVIGDLNATSKGSELRVLSLPELALVHTHSLEGIALCGLAADPWGCALAVSDGVSRVTHVLAWPLPGMPLLA